MPERLIQKLHQRDRLTEQEKATLRRLPVQERSYAGGDVLVHFGDRPKTSNLLLEGFVCRYRDMNDGSRQIVAIHVPGDFVDLQSFLLKLMDHGLMAIGPCRIAIVPHEHLTRVTEEHPHLTRMLWFSTIMDAAIHREWAMRLGGLSAVPRAAHLFCELYARLGVVGIAKDGKFSIPLTQRELSESLGLSLVHTNRVMRQLHKEGLMTFNNPAVQIHNWDALTERAEFDPTYLHFEKVPR
jgi:CRP-like cAMP-binding protein